MSTKTVTPYGSWRSPITSDLIVSSSIRLGEIMVDGSTLYWTESRPAEKGRNVIVKWHPELGMDQITPEGFNVRTRVHEYGGGAFAVHQGDIYFINYADQRLYRQAPDGEPVPVTPESKFRYADFAFDPRHHRIICVCEDHTAEQQQPSNRLVSIDLDGSLNPVTSLVTGHDFFATPRLSPNGRQLVWLNWDHPNMPWDGTELWGADISPDGSLRNIALIAGGKEVSIFQPEYSPEGVLHFVSDQSGWWNLYRWQEGQAEPLYPMSAEFGLPQWVFGMSTYAFESENRILCTYTQNGSWQLARLQTGSGHLAPINLPYSDISNLKGGPGYAVFFGRSPTEVSSVVRLDLQDDHSSVLRRSSSLTVDEGYLSIPQPVEFPTEQGECHGLYYPPFNQDHLGPLDERPPLLVMSHGGPTAMASMGLDLRVQYWTSRGIGVLDVNYGGSTGYGRAYRQRLNGQWGIVDTNDCVNGARYLVGRELADSQRLAIRGGSAGGYTTLCAITFHDLFKASACYYGISNIESLAVETHKFESRYIDNLIGPYPEAKARYQERSPINFVDQIRCPVIFFQGLEDLVVPPAQSEMMVQTLLANGVTVAYVPFEGEQHGFRQASSIKRALDSEMFFYGRIFGFDPADQVEPVTIKNL